MFKDAKTFCSFSVHDLQKAKNFYGDILGLELKETKEGLELHMANGTMIFLYPKADHAPATFTVLNFMVDNIDNAFKALKEKSVKFEHYDGMTDENGIARGLEHNRGPNIAWFKDPAGNFLSIIQEK